MQYIKKTLHANAKLNLYLYVTGYKEIIKKHNVSTVMCFLKDVYDVIEIEYYPNKEFSIKVTCSDDSIAQEDNLITKAVYLMHKQFKITGHININLIKNIPLGSGMGGGSADAAAVMNSINEVYQLNIPLEDLMILGRTLGSDVPSCLVSSMNHTSGIGGTVNHQLYKEYNLDKYYAIIISNTDPMNTTLLYNDLRNDLITLDKPYSQVPKNSIFLDSQNVMQSFNQYTNVFTPYVKKRSMKISAILSLMENNHNGAILTRLSGTGDCVFSIYDNYDKCLQHYKQLTKIFNKSFVAMSGIQ